MCPQYNGPLVVISHNRGSAYILCELDGTVLDCPVTAFCVIPYFTRRHIEIPKLEQLLNIDTTRL